MAASFDCAKASTKHEKMICDNPELNEADEIMGNYYYRTMQKDPNGEIFNGEIYIEDINIKELSAERIAEYAKLAQEVRQQTITSQKSFNRNYKKCKDVTSCIALVDEQKTKLSKLSAPIDCFQPFDTPTQNYCDGLKTDIHVSPSFKCSDAKAESEHSICQSLPLSIQDQLLSSTYKKAKVFLTNDYKNLKTDQIAFIKDRNSCKKNVKCIERKADERIKKLDYLIEKSYKNPKVKIFNVNNIPHELRSKKYYMANYPMKADEETTRTTNRELFNINISLGSKNIHISNGQNNKMQQCLIDRQTSNTFANVYYKTMYKKSYYGTWGGSVTRLPYFGYYNLIELKDSKTHENCGNLIVSFNEDSKPLFSYSKSDPIDGLLIADGHILTNK